MNIYATCRCGCGNAIEQIGIRPRVWFKNHRSNAAAKRIRKRDGNDTAKQILRGLGREPLSDNRDKPLQSYGIWQPGLYYALMCAIIYGMVIL